MSSSTLYFFIYGRNPKLSKAEIFSYIFSHSICGYPEFLSEEYAILRIESKFNPTEVAKDLAGTVKIGKIYTKIDLKADILAALQNEVFYIEDSKTLNYSLSMYGRKVNEQNFISTFRQIFKESKQKAVLKKPSPSSLWNALQKRNFVDLVICKSLNHYYIGRTIASYNIKQNKKRYEQRPHIDESIGSSIRFSRILVNLSGVDKGKLLDPFCGIGTVLQEGLMLGFDVFGSELEKERVKNCKENLKWTIKEFKPASTSFEVHQSDARNIHEIFPRDFFDTIVTEPELGPFLKTIPSYSEAQSIIKTLTDLYSSTFYAVDKILKPKGSLLIVLPQFITLDKKKINVDVQALISNTRLKPIMEIKIFDTSVNFPIHYKESWHKLGRLIFLFRKM